MLGGGGRGRGGGSESKCLEVALVLVLALVLSLVGKNTPSMEFRKKEAVAIVFLSKEPGKARLPRSLSLLWFRPLIFICCLASFLFNPPFPPRALPLNPSRNSLHAIPLYTSSPPPDLQLTRVEGPKGGARPPLSTSSEPTRPSSKSSSTSSSAPIASGLAGIFSLSLPGGCSSFVRVSPPRRLLVHRGDELRGDEFVLQLILDYVVPPGRSRAPPNLA